MIIFINAKSHDLVPYIFFTVVQDVNCWYIHRQLADKLRAFGIIKFRLDWTNNKKDKTFFYWGTNRDRPVCIIEFLWVFLKNIPKNLTIKQVASFPKQDFI